MHTNIYYFSGTGNSLMLAKSLSYCLPNSSVLPISGGFRNIHCDAIGLAFPVYAWGAPRIVTEFCEALPPDKYLFAVVNYASNPGLTLQQLNTIFLKKGNKLSAGFGVAMPDNFIPLVGPASKELQTKLFASASDTINTIAETILAKKELLLTPGYSLKNIFLSRIVYKLFFRLLHKFDRFFKTKECCNSCAICEKVCPVGNIKLIKGKPVWQSRCEACMACIQWCPKQAIDYWILTAKRSQYQNPAINLIDMLHKDF